MLTLKDIAEVANVSVSTVSRVINDKSNISEETKAKVHRVITELAYKPGTVFRKLASRSYTIGLFVPIASDFANDDPTTSVDLNSLKEELENLKHNVQLTTHHGHLDKSSVSFRIIEQREIDGAIVCDPFVQDEYVAELSRHGIPYIVTNGRYRTRGCSFVDYNNEEGARLVIAHLVALGHRNIGVLAGPSDHLVTENRTDGCRAAMQSSPCPITLPEVSGPFSLDAGYRGAQKLLADHPEITAIFAYSDNIAFGAMKAIREAGLTIPDDLSIVGFDDMALAQYMEPPLTTVRRFRYDINVLISRAMEDLIANSTIECLQVSLKTELVIRDSCAAPRRAP